jgi:hypothetical protein
MLLSVMKLWVLYERKNVVTAELSDFQEWLFCMMLVNITQKIYATAILDTFNTHKVSCKIHRHNLLLHQIKLEAVLLHTTVILACCKVLAIWTKSQTWNRPSETVLVDYPLTHHADQVGFSLWNNADTSNEYKQWFLIMCNKYKEYVLLLKSS